MIADLPEPTAFANTPTAAILAPGRAVASLGYGSVGFKTAEVVTLGLQLGLGGGWELGLTGGAGHYKASFPVPDDHWTPAGAAGLKRSLGRVGAWDAAAAIAGTWAGGNGPHGATVWAAVPCTTAAGAWQWTVGPRVFLPSLLTTSPINAYSLGLLAGGLWRFHDAWSLWTELHPAWFQGGYPVVAPSVGLRGRAWPGGWLEAGMHLDPFFAGHHPLAQERTGFLAATAKQAF